MVLDAALPVNREEPAGGGLHAVCLVEGLQRLLPHQLGPAIHAVGVVRRADHVLGEVQLLRHVLLDVIGIHAAGGGENEFVDAGLLRGFDQHSVERQVLGALGLVHVDVAPAPVDGREMKDRVDAFDRLRRHVLVEEVLIDEFHPMRVEMALDVLDLTRAEVVDDPDVVRATLHELVDQVRADE